MRWYSMVPEGIPRGAPGSSLTRFRRRPIFPPMPDPLAPLKRCELHVHAGGCLSVEDLIEMVGGRAGLIDWRSYVEAFEAAYGRRPDPAAMFRRAAGDQPAAVEELRRHFVFTEEDGPDFARFSRQVQSADLHRPPLHEACSVRRPGGHAPRPGAPPPPRRALRGDAGPLRPDGRSAWLRRVPPDQRRGHRARCAAAASSRGMCPPCRAPRRCRRTACCAGSWPMTGRIWPKIVAGVDFCNVEEGYPPKGVRGLFRRLRADNDAEPQDALEVLYHVGEIYFDKSLESAVRWCHEAAELGSRRLGHCIALGLDPEVSMQRRGGSHLRESVAEGLDQIAYDLRHRRGLEDAGVEVEPADPWRRSARACGGGTPRPSAGGPTTSTASSRCAGARVSSSES